MRAIGLAQRQGSFQHFRPPILCEKQLTNLLCTLLDRMEMAAALALGHKLKGKAGIYTLTRQLQDGVWLALYLFLLMNISSRL